MKKKWYHLTTTSLILNAVTVAVFFTITAWMNWPYELWQIPAFFIAICGADMLIDRLTDRDTDK